MKKIALAVLISLFAVLPSASAAAIVLPDPSGTFDGLPVAVQYDQFFSYSTQLLTQFVYAGFNGAAGVGGLDVVVLTGANGIKNNPVSGGLVFEDPLASASGGTSTFSGTWGAGNNPNGPVLVDTLLTYLHNQFDPTVNIPVFTFDLAEPGSAASRDLDMLAKFSVYDPVNHVDVATWALDGTDNGVFDASSFAHVYGELSFTGLSSTVYTADAKGSGKYDYLVYAPGMDLSAYSGHGYEFHIFSEMKNLDGSGEEAFISGGIRTPTPPTAVPEPGTILLVGIGLLGLGRRRFTRFLSLQ